MKALEDVINSYEDHETSIDDRFGRRLLQFLTKEQAAEIGYELKDGREHHPKEWTEENVLDQLKEDLEFGIEKALNHKGISASLMQEVVVAWCWVLENGLEDCEYGWYGSETFKAVDEYYGFGLTDGDTFDDEFYDEW